MKKYSFLFLFLLVLFSCRKDDLHPSWDTDLLLPIAYTQLNIQDLLPDSIENINEDSSVSLVYQSNLATFILDTLLTIPDTIFSYVASLNNINLNPFAYSYRVSMGSIALKDKEENGPSGPIYTAIITAHNTGQPTQLASFGPYQYDSVKINMGNYFKYIYVRQATLEYTVNNQLPIPISDLAFKLVKESTNELLIDDIFSIIPPNTQQSKSITLQNIVLDSLLLASFSVSSPGSMIPVVIDTNQAATATVTIKDLQIDSAIARFPQQELLAYNDVLRLSLPDSMQLTETWVKSGWMEIEFFNTINQNIHLNFELPAAQKNGQTLNIQLTIPASTSQQPGHTQTTVDLSQYKIKFRGMREFELINGDLNNNQIIDPDTVNSLYYKLSASIDSTGEFITLTKNDSITASCRFINIIPDYIKGFFGYKELSIDSSTVLSFINNLQAEQLHFDKTNISLSLENQIGTTARAYIEELTAKNTNNQQQLSLQGSVLTTPLIIQKPNDPQNTQTDVIPTINTFMVNHQNSNINDLISILPNKLSYSFRLKMNDQLPIPSPASASDFLYYGDKITAKLNVEVPLSFYANNLVLCDTVEANFDTTNINNIKQGKIILQSTNYFPFDLTVTIYTLDSNKVMYDSIHSVPIIIKAGQLNTQLQKVTHPGISKNTLPINSAKLNRILRAKYLNITASLNTKPTQQHLKVYDYYSLQLKLIGDFTYLIEKQ